MEIVVRQISGLGNQLFQYAAGRYYAKRYGARLGLVMDAAQNAVSHGYPRPFLLPHFSIPIPFREVSRLDRLMFTNRAVLKQVAAVVKKTAGVRIFDEPVSRRFTFMEDLPMERGVRMAYLVGYWQTHRIVEAVAAELRNELRFKQAATGRNLEMLKLIEGSSDAVSLHIRRGDYTLAAEGNIALPIEYYLRAIKSFRERLSKPSFFIFSDDMDFARAHLPRDLRMVFVDHNGAETSHEDLRLMSSCRHHIIANSTFSWWGAWLNGSPDKIVFAPRQWHLTPESYFPDLMPPEWTLVDSRAQR